MLDSETAEAIGGFYASHKQELFTYAISITASPACAEDAVHEAFRNLLAARRLPRELRPYAFRCVRNAALDTRRAANRERRKLDGYQVLFEETRNEQVREATAEILATLSDSEREIVVLKVFSGLTFREIAEVCGVRQGTAAASYWRSLQKLRQRLSNECGLEPELKGCEQ